MVQMVLPRNVKASICGRGHAASLSVLQASLDDLPQLLSALLVASSCYTRRKVQYATLGQRAFDELIHIAAAVSNGLEPARHAEPVQEAGNRVEERGTNSIVGEARDGRVGDRRAVEDGKCLAVAVGGRGRRELEH
jgi:hypothetical protein